MDIAILAQAGSPDDQTNTSTQAPSDQGGGDTGSGNPGPSMMPMILIMGAVLVFMMLMSGRKQKKQQQEREAKLQNELQKGKTVVTIGGVRGVVHDVREDEVVVKVDEASNVKMTFERSAIRDVN